MQEAIRSWTRQLIDLSGRNNLLYFRDLKAGTLDLGVALVPPHAERVLAGRQLRLSQLFPDPDALKDAARRARTLLAKATENREERGLETLYLARGMATWKSDRSASTPAAPVLLYPLVLARQGVAGEDFTFAAAPEPELNPTLLHLLETDFGIRIAPEELLFSPSGEALDPEAVVLRLQEACREAPGFRTSERLVAGNFSYAKLPMVRDLERSQAAIEQHSLLSAIAGDVSAREVLHERQRQSEERGIPAVPPPAEEYLVLDADGSQSAVISSAVAGADLVVIGPPGTGKSQTISNLIATLIARGASVLFVAEKRAAIEAVVNRLEKCQLGDVVLDLHDGASNRRRVAAELERALQSTSAALAPDVDRLHLQLSRRRAELEQYADDLHDRTAPWDISAFEAQARILGIPEQCRSPLRFGGPVLETLGRERINIASEDIRRFVELDGRKAHQPQQPWSATYAAGRVRDGEAAQGVLAALRHLQHAALPALTSEVSRFSAAHSLPPPATIDDAIALAELLEDAAAAAALFRPTVFELDLAEAIAGMAPARGGLASRLTASLFDGDFRRARAALRAASVQRGLPDSRILEHAELARGVQERWQALVPALGSHPRPVAGSEALIAATSELTSAMTALATSAGAALPAAATFEAQAADLQELEAGADLLRRFPELHRLEDSLRNAHLGPALDRVIGNSLPAADASLVVEHAWLASVLDAIRAAKPALAAFSAEAHEAATEEFIAADHRHIEVSADRVRRAWAENAVRTRDEFPRQAAQVARQASLKRRHMPLRDLFDRAEDVLTAVKPCWVMSPLVVAQVLPARPCFDVVIFDEASQILPADAACSLLRGKQAVIAGDPHQLPPTTFFYSDNEDLDDAEEEEAELTGALESSLTRGQESILDVARVLLPPPHGTRVLSWHYRSRDERLITFSNAQESLYDWSLTTFPGALEGKPISHVLVEAAPVPRVAASTPDEVSRVVELVREHARLRPEESLGVIALGNVHAERISEALRLAAAEAPELAALMEDERPEKLFVKNLERVQGDERDAIVLSVGYSRSPDGRVRYNFGPINQEGGVRRLNVAVTRARRRMTVVSSFSGSEMDPDRASAPGPRMLRDYLLYAESGGSNIGIRRRNKPELNGFERDVQQRLEAQGLRVVPQHGASGYWIDFAVMHPQRPSDAVLAVETDGVMYRSGASARDRDRLRQEHLERLGWRFHRIWSTHWFQEPGEEAGRVVAAFEDAVHEVSGNPGPGLIDQDPPPAYLLADPGRNQAGRADWPGIRRGLPITEYAHWQLRRVVAWVLSDGRLYTEEELLDEVLDALGFGRRGNRIVAAIRAAIRAERGS